VLLTAGWVSLSLNKLAIARTQLLQAWTVRDASITSSIAINLGHISLIEKNRAEAIQWYQKGKDSAEDVSLFYKELRADYESLSLSEKQITLEAYQLILKQFKCNDSE